VGPWCRKGEVIAMAQPARKVNLVRLPKLLATGAGAL
jgi:hypothetical protein